VISAESRGAWQELHERLRPFVARRVQTPADADDVLQEVFVRLQRGISSLRDDERFGPWVYRIAKNAIVDHERRRVRREARETEIAEDVPGAPGDPADHLESELAECVALFVAELPSPYREAVTLTELQGLTQKQAAELLGVSLSGMKSRVQRGRDKIRQMFEACCEISLDCRGRVVGCEPRAIDEVSTGCQPAAKSWARRGQ
jgi:RNA polymerase sigma-70 factor, ECF subfamily